jgi:hypothetical protein
MSALFLFFGGRGEGVWLSARCWRAVLSCIAPSFLYSAEFFPSVRYVRPSVDWRLASGCNADAGSVRGVYGRAASPLICQIVLVPRLGVLPIRATRAFDFWARFVPGVFPDPNPMRLPMKKRFARRYSRAR